MQVYKNQNQHWIDPTIEIWEENAARRDQVQKFIDNAQQEEAFREFFKLLGTNYGIIPYGTVKNVDHSYHLNGYKAVDKNNLYYHLSQNIKSTTQCINYH